MVNDALCRKDRAPIPGIPTTYRPGANPVVSRSQIPGEPGNPLPVTTVAGIPDVRLSAVFFAGGPAMTPMVSMNRVFP